MNPSFDDTKLSAYVDGELDTTTMREVEEFIDRDENARQYLLDTVKTNAHLRASFNEVLQEEVPQHLLVSLSPQRLQAGRSPMLRHFLHMAVATILLLIGFGTATILERNGSKNFTAFVTPLPARYSQVVNEALEYNLSGMPRQWQAPRDSVILTVTPVRTYRDRNGLYYREYRLEITHDMQRARLSGLAYRAANGKWQTKALFF